MLFKFKFICKKSVRVVTGCNKNLQAKIKYNIIKELHKYTHIINELQIFICMGLAFKLFRALVGGLTIAKYSTFLKNTL